MQPADARRIVAEGVGTSLLLAAVVGSGIMAERLAGGNHAIALGLLSVIWGCSRRSATVPFAVAAYITAAYWFTASTSFANPAVTIARSLTDTFTGIRPADAPGFSGAQSSALPRPLCFSAGSSRLPPHGR